jgi:AcrR family transcriptional regulator
MPPQERREQLLDVTLALARRDGMQGLSIERVAREAGVTRPVVYGIFDDLDGLLDALAAREEPRALADVAAAIPDDPAAHDPDEILVRSVRLFLGAVTAQPDRWHLILLPPEGTPAHLRERIEKNREAILGELEALVAWGLRRRGGPHLDAELMARMILTLAEDAARMLLSEPGTTTLEEVAAFTAAALTALERAEPDPAGAGGPPS